MLSFDYSFHYAIEKFIYDNRIFNTKIILKPYCVELSIKYLIFLNCENILDSSTHDMYL